MYTPLAKDSTNINDDDGKYIMDNNDDDDAKSERSWLIPSFLEIPRKIGAARSRCGHVYMYV